jgi:hypothetical protein
MLPRYEGAEARRITMDKHLHSPDRKRKEDDDQIEEAGLKDVTTNNFAEQSNSRQAQAPNDVFAHSESAHVQRIETPDTQDRDLQVKNKASLIHDILIPKMQSLNVEEDHTAKSSHISENHEVQESMLQSQKTRVTLSGSDGSFVQHTRSGSGSGRRGNHNGGGTKSSIHDKGEIQNDNKPQLNAKKTPSGPAVSQNDMGDTSGDEQFEDTPVMDEETFSKHFAGESRQIMRINEGACNCSTQVRADSEMRRKQERRQQVAEQNSEIQASELTVYRQHDDAGQQQIHSKVQVSEQIDSAGKQEVRTIINDFKDLSLQKSSQPIHKVDDQEIIHEPAHKFKKPSSHMFLNSIREKVGERCQHNGQLQPKQIGKPDI